MADLWRSIARNAVLGSAIVASSVGAQQPRCTAHADSASTSIDSALVAAMREHHVPGAAVSVVRDGRIELLAGYGCADVDRDVAVDPRTTVFHVASVSKPFVALAVLQLAERHTVDLHNDVNGYLRGVVVPAAWNRPVTLHDLLTHTAGFDESIVGYAARTPAELRPLGEFLAEKLPARGWSPGDVTGYSNYGYALAGYVVESVARQSFADYAESEILRPLGMTHSSFAQPMPPELDRLAAVAYRCSGADCTPIARDYRSAYPPGGLVTTASDMSRFLQAALGVETDGRRVISDSVLTWMHTRQFSNAPALPGLTYGLAEDHFLGVRSLSHAGGASGFSSLVMMFPETRSGVFIVANGGSSRFGTDALLALGPLLPAAPSAEAPDPERVTVRAVDPSGAYRLTRYAHRGVENLPTVFSGQLHVRQLGGDTISIIGLGADDGEYVPVDTARWRRVGADALVAARVRDGRVTHVFGPASFFGTTFPAAYERLAWYDEPHFLNELLSYLLMVPVLMLLAWPVVAAIVWFVRRRTSFVARVRPALGSGRRWAIVAAIVAVALVASFGFGFIAVSSRAAERGGGDIVYGLPASMRVLAWAPPVIALLSLALLVIAPLAWRRRWWSIPGRLIYTTIAVDLAVFVIVMAHWGYFPLAA